MISLNNDESKSKKPAVSVIIASYNSWPQIKVCIDSLYKQKTSSRFDIIVADSSSDGTAVKLKENYPDLKLIVLSEQTFPGPARNAAIKQARADIIVSVDCDCEVCPEWINTIVGSHSLGYDVVGGAIINGTPKSYIGTSEYLMEFSEYMPSKKITKLRMIPTCNLSLKKSIYEMIGGFEEIKTGKWLFKGEDVLFCHRIRNKGFSIYFNPQMKIKHYNRIELRKFFVNQFYLGFSTSVCRRIVKMKGTCLLKSLGFDLFIPFIKVLRVGLHCLKGGVSSCLSFIFHLPLIFLGSVAFGFGFNKGRKIKINS